MNNTLVKAANPKPNSDVVEYQAGKETVILSPEYIKKYLAGGNPNVTDSEAVMFLNLCRYQHLNPFLREAYLIKYGTAPATMVVGKDTFVKRARANKDFDGFQAGLMVLDKDGNLVEREGSFRLPTDTLLGANLTIASPMDECELRRLMFTAQLPDKGPFVIRYPRGSGSVVDWRCKLEEIPVGKGRKLRDGSDIAVITLGPIGVLAAEAIEECSVCCDSVATNPTATHGGLTIAHYDLRFLKPLDEEMLHEIGKRFQKIVTIEDGVRNGGMGSAVMEWLSDHGYRPHVKRLGLPDNFVEHGTVEQLQHIVGIDKESIKKAII